MIKKQKDFEIIGSSEADKFMRQNIVQFLNNITFNENYKKLVQEVQNNFDRINLFNLLKEIQNGGKNNVKNRK
ncbi:MAG: hypothetical protein ACFE9S_15595 [Candidatus Hermodarchaeota archaeon]